MARTDRDRDRLLRLQRLELVHHARGVARDLELFVGRDHERAHARGGGGHVEDRRVVVDLRVVVAIFVEGEAEEVEALQDALPHRRAVLADAAREHDRVEPAHHRRVCADVFPHSVREDVDREARAIVAFGGARLDLPQIVGDPGQAREAALLVEQRLGAVHAEVSRELQHDARIEIAGARAHHEAFERRQTHRGLDAVAVLDRARARAVAEVE